MRTKVVFPLAILIISVVCTGLFCLGASGDPFSGMWKLNLAKSKLPPPPPQSQATQVEADAKGIRMKEVIVTDKGEQLNIAVAAKFDGQDYPVTGTPLADTVAYKRVNKHTITGVAKKAGKVVATERAVVSANGKTLTVTFTSADASGKPVTGVGVFEKQ
jgi:hypothetical protein